MKKLLLSILLLVTILSNAQNFSQGNSSFNIGLGLGSVLNESGYKTTFPPLEAQYEYFINDNLSVGGTIAYAAAKNEDSSYGYNYTMTVSNFIFGGICNYQLYDNDKLNAYIGGKLAYDKVTVKTDSSSLGFHESAPESDILFGAQIGGRYFISDNMALNAELGYGIAIFKIGVSVKL